MSQDAAPDFTTEADPKDAATGKYFQVRVPDFTKVTTPGDTKRDAYLRIGSMAKFTDGDRGKELFEQFTGFAADSGVEWHERDASGEDVARPVRYGFDGETAVFATKTQEEKRAALIAGAAWRDHCDGNRVTTTSGDKVEIVGGNYHLLVLGRAASADGASFDDHSGGNHIDGTVSPPQTVSTLSFTPKYVGGQWSMVEESRKASVHAIFTGYFREDFRGPTRLSVTGKLPPAMVPLLAALGEVEIPDTEEELAEGGLPLPSPSDVNPVITEFTFATSITEYTGSVDAPVTKIASTTHALTVDESVNVTANFDDSHNVLGAFASTTTVGGTLTETTTVGGALTSTTSAGSFTESLASNTAYATESVGARFDMAFIGSRMTLETVGDDLNVRAIGADVVVQVGKHSEVFIGVHSETTVGRRNEIVAGSEVEFTAADHLSTHTLSQTIAATMKSSALAIFIG